MNTENYFRKFDFENEEDYLKFKEQIIKEIKEEILNEQIKNETLYNKKRITSSKIRNKYANQIMNKFGTTGVIDSAIRTVATYKMGQRKISQISSKELENWESILDFLYKYVLGE